jgi:hypothetical protein
LCGARDGARRPRPAALAAACAAGALAAAACDPCTGVASCRQAPRLGVSGQIVDRGMPVPDWALSGAGPSAAPASGVRVEVIPTDGVDVDEPSASATSDGTGWWEVSMRAAEEGPVLADVVVTPPDGVAYRVRGVLLNASRKRGDGNVLGRWTREPYITTLGEVFDAASGARVAGARVTAVRRGGIEIAPTVNSRVPMVTVDGGRFLFEVRPLADGPLLLDFVVERDGLPPATVRNVTVQPQYEWLPPNVNGDLIFRLDAAGNRVSN